MQKPRHFISTHCKQAEPASAGPLIAWMVWLSLAVIFWAVLQPTFVAAAVSDEAALEDVLQQAEHEFAQQRYEQAEQFFAQALEIADADQHQQISYQLDRCVAWAAVESRYEDNSFLSSIEQADAESADVLLDTTISIIQQRYYRNCDARKLISNALWQLQAAAQRHGNAEALTAAIDTERHIINESKEVTLNHVRGITARLTAVGRQTGYAQGWAALQMAYALADSLDEYSHLLSPGRYQEFYSQLAGAYVGIGVDIIIQNSQAIVFDVVPYSPAAQAGLLPGDIIKNAADIELGDDITAGQLARLLRGVRGSHVNVTVLRGQGELSRRLTRQVVAAPSVRQQRVIEGTDTGYLRVSTFDSDTAMEIRRAVTLLQLSGAKNLIIDLRNNGGGMMNSAVYTAGMFLERGVIMTLQTASQQQQFNAESNTYPAFDMPLVLLVNNHTASAAEILTAALQDNRRAIVIGQQTLGKGIVQTVLPIPNSRAGITITTAQYLSPNGVCFHRVGIEPDIQVAYPDNSQVISAATLAQVDDPAIHAAIHATININ